MTNPPLGLKLKDRVLKIKSIIVALYKSLWYNRVMNNKRSPYHKMTREELSAHLHNRKGSHIHKNKKKVIKRKEKYKHE